MIQPGNRQLFQEAIATIRVDPDQTYVYYQEARTFGRDAPFALQESRVSVTEFNTFPAVVELFETQLKPKTAISATTKPTRIPTPSLDLLFFTGLASKVEH